MNLLKLRKYPKSERSSFSYWFAHYRAYNVVAWRCGCWKFKYLFHDIEKPWLKLIWKDYKKVQKWHREHNSHHIEYYLKYGKADWEAMAIDWQSSMYTKLTQPYPAREYLHFEMIKRPELADPLNKNMTKVLDKLGL